MLSIKTTKMIELIFSELTDFQWQFIDNIINDQRKRKHSLKTIVNVIFLSIMGCTMAKFR